MPRLIKRQTIAAGLTLTAALLLSPLARAQAPAELAPANIPLYIHVDSPAEWFVDLTQGPLGQKLRDSIETNEGSGDLLAALGMNTDQFMSAYFGSDVVILGPGQDKDGVIFTKVSQADRAHAITSLALKRQGDIAGNPVYVGPDGGGYIVMMDKWVAMCDLSAVEFLTGILELGPNAPRLGNSERYNKWTRDLPADRAMTLLSSESADEHHAIGVIRDGKGLDATYLGTSPDFDELMSMLGETAVADFGPLPADTIGAMSFNIVANEEMKQKFQGLDAMLGGKSFVDDVMPKLDPPTLMFMGSVKGDAVEPAVSVEIPTAGMAFRMNDDSVAADLNKMFDSVVMLSNFAIAQYKAGAIPQRDATYKNASYRVAEIGQIVAQGLDFPELAPMQIVYGQVGDYFIVCSQEVFFQQCVDAGAADKGKRIDVEGPVHRLAKTPVIAMTGRPDGLAEVIRTWGVMLQDKGLPEAVAGENPAPIDFEGLFDVVTMLQQYSGAKMQVWSGDDGIVIGRAQLTAPQ